MAAKGLVVINDRPRATIGPAMHTNQLLAQPLVNLLCCKSKIKPGNERKMNQPYYQPTERQHALAGKLKLFPY
jgi:hypothetical protein